MYIAIPVSVGSDATGNLTYMTGASASSCGTLNTDVELYWDTYYRYDLEALVQASRDSWKIVNGLTPYNAGSHVYDFYGPIASESVPIWETLATVDEGRTTGGGTMKEYRTAQRTGEILFRPMRAWKAELRCGVKPVNPVLLGPTSYRVAFPGQLPRKATGCFAYPLKPYDQKSGFFVFSDPVSQVTRNWYQVSSFEQVDPDVLKGYGLLLANKLDELTPDTGLVTSCRARANEGLLDLYTSLAESPETVKMLYDLIKAVFIRKQGTIEKIMAQIARNPANAVSIASNAWLQYRYGIMPLYYDVRGLLEYLGAATKEFMTVRSSSTVQESISIGSTYNQLVVDVEHRVTIKNRLDIHSTKMEQYLRTDLTVTAWELVPLSFVWDWFVSVGDFLASLSAPQASVQEAAMYSFRCKTPVSVSSKDNLHSVQIKPDYYRAITINPSDHIGLTMRFGMNLQRTLDALALSWGSFKAYHRR